MNICFVLPRFSKNIYGGYKMVYEYANRICNKGYNVTIVFINEKTFQKYHIPHFFKRLGNDILTQIEPRWFELDKRIVKISGLNKNISRIIDKTDVVVATSIDTVKYVDVNFRCSNKVYFIQGYENWNASENEVACSYKLGFHNVVISSWLEKIVNGYTDVPCTLIKNPVDTNIYRVVTSLDSRKLHSVAFLYHKSEVKGVRYTLEAISKLKEKYPDISVHAFGTFERNEELPEYVDYTYKASQLQTVDIYNSSTVFLCSTIDEGYGLTGLEAMACGTVLVSSSYGGVLEYAEHEYNALLSPVKNVDELVKNVCRVFEDDTLRDKLSSNGVKTVEQGFNWEDAVDKFLKIME